MLFLEACEKKLKVLQTKVQGFNFLDKSKDHHIRILGRYATGSRVEMFPFCLEPLLIRLCYDRKIEKNVQIIMTHNYV